MKLKTATAILWKKTNELFGEPNPCSRCLIRNYGSLDTVRYILSTLVHIRFIWKTFKNHCVLAITQTKNTRISGDGSHISVSLKAPRVIPTWKQDWTPLGKMVQLPTIQGTEVFLQLHSVTRMFGTVFIWGSRPQLKIKSCFAFLCCQVEGTTLISSRRGDYGLG